MTIPLGIFNPAQAAFLLGVAAVLGACLGSFVNCLAWRLANGESVLAGRSHCTSCGHVLGALDLVPVASWLALRGRCRHCGQRVSPRYVIVEALVAALFAAVVARYGLSVQTAAYLVLVCILMAVALVDLDTFIIPNGFVVAGCVLWLVSIWFMPAPRVDAFSVGSLFSGWVHPGGAVALDGEVIKEVGALSESADGVPYGVGVRVCSGVFRTFFAGRGRRRGGKRPNKGDSVRAGHCRGHGVHAVGGADHPHVVRGVVLTGYAAG